MTQRDVARSRAGRSAPAEPADQVGHQHLGGAVDGQRAELRRRADARRAAPAPCGNRPRPCRRRCRRTRRPRPGPCSSTIARTRAPRSSRQSSHVVGLQRAVDPHQRPLDAIRMVVHLRQRPALGARVPVRQRVVRVAAHPDDLVALDVDEDPAHRRADPAEAPDRAHFRVAPHGRNDTDSSVSSCRATIDPPRSLAAARRALAVRTERSASSERAHRRSRADHRQLHGGTNVPPDAMCAAISRGCGPPACRGAWRGSSSPQLRRAR